MSMSAPPPLPLPPQVVAGLEDPSCPVHHCYIRNDVRKLMGTRWLRRQADNLVDDLADTHTVALVTNKL